MSGSKPLPVLLLAVVMAACSAPANRNSSDANSAATANTNAAPATSGTASAAATEALTRAIGAQLNAKSYRARIDATINGEETARTIEYVAPDRFHITSEADETLIIGDTVWA